MLTSHDTMLSVAFDADSLTRGQREIRTTTSEEVEVKFLRFLTFTSSFTLCLTGGGDEISQIMYCSDADGQIQ